MFTIRRIKWTISIITLALAGLVITQIFWINDAIKLKDEEFDKLVRAAFYESMDDYHTVTNKSKSRDTGKLIQTGFIPEHAVNLVDSLMVTPDGDTAIVKMMDYKVSGNDKLIYKQCCIITESTDIDSLQEYLLKEGEKVCRMKMQEINMHNSIQMNQPGTEKMEAIEKRFDLKKFDGILKKNLEQNGITLDYLLIAGYEGEKMAMFNSDEARSSADFIMENEHTVRATILEADMTYPALKSYLLFPNHKIYLIRDIWYILAASAGLILILIFAFYYSIKTILIQKKLSDVKNDFINNMTHELKTPISTIGLACEMLNDDSISTTEKQRKNYVGMIRDESKRLGTLVESVLQSAVIERGELTLKPEKIEINELIREVTTNFEIQVHQRGAILNLKLNAAHDFVFGDRVHLSNVIFNLLDNANKYSFEKPDITISTGNAGDKIIISVSDRGIGIQKEAQKKIFEKLYRIPTGNVHNVKGFGLGLSYVKAVIEKHAGEVNVTSETGKGSTFTLSLPLYHGKEN